MSVICSEDGLLAGIVREFEQKIGRHLIPRNAGPARLQPAGGQQ